MWWCTPLISVIGGQRSRNSSLHYSKFEASLGPLRSHIVWWWQGAVNVLYRLHTLWSHLALFLSLLMKPFAVHFFCQNQLFQFYLGIYARWYFKARLNHAEFLWSFLCLVTELWEISPTSQSTHNKGEREGSRAVLIVKALQCIRLSFPTCLL